MINYNAIICRYHEIATKGNNRSMFEKHMMENIRYFLSEIEKLKISKVRGRIFISKKTDESFTPSELQLAVNRLQHAGGLESFSPVLMCNTDINEIKKRVDESCSEIFENKLKNKDTVSFRIRARRSIKEFPLDSKEIELELAETVTERVGENKLTVNLKNADITVGCEVRSEFAFVYYDIYRGPGGLPTGSNSPVLALLSGGIDSPAACYLMMKRGCPVNFISFHSFPYTPPETTGKVKEIAKLLNTFQKPGRLFLCNISEFQKLVRDCCTEKFRTILYRRAMFRIAERTAFKYHFKALLTGESVGQVASQTIRNMSVTNSAVNMLVLRPLSGTDKIETIKMAENIGTFDISKKQVPDSCTVFAPRSPATSVSEQIIVREEKKIAGYDEVIEMIADQVEEIQQ